MVNPFDVIKLVEEQFYLKPGTLCGPKRTKSVAQARFIAMYLVKENTYYSLTEIAEHFNRTHTTVMHALNVIPYFINNREIPIIKSIITKLQQQVANLNSI